MYIEIIIKNICAFAIQVPKRDDLVSIISSASCDLNTVSEFHGLLRLHSPLFMLSTKVR